MNTALLWFETQSAWSSGAEVIHFSIGRSVFDTLTQLFKHNFQCLTVVSRNNVHVQSTLMLGVSKRVIQTVA